MNAECHICSVSLVSFLPFLTDTQRLFWPVRWSHPAYAFGRVLQQQKGPTSINFWMRCSATWPLMIFMI